jgi:hypothetical protein
LHGQSGIESFQPKKNPGEHRNFKDQIVIGRFSGFHHAFAFAEIEIGPMTLAQVKETLAVPGRVAVH